MPVNIMIGMLALLVALVLYSWGTWGAFRHRSVSRKHALLIWIGLAFDVLATAMMALQAGGIMNDLHTYLAFFGLGGMALAAAVGTWALSREREQVLSLVARAVVLPWLVWVIVFVWGMLERGSQRLA